MKSFSLFTASPKEFCSELDAKLASLDVRLSEMTAQSEAVAQLCETFLRSGLSDRALPQAASSWTYYAAMPNRYFSDLFEAEDTDAGPKRWVGPSGRVGARLRLGRLAQYDFSVHVSDFSTPELAHNFALSIDGIRLPWLTKNDNVFTTLVHEDPDAADLAFELSVDPAAIPAGKDVSFSFRMMSFQRR